MPNRPSHIAQLPTGPVGVQARGAASGAAIYCAYANFSGGTAWGGTAQIVFTIAARSTFNVQIVWEFAGGGNATWSLEKNDRSSYSAIAPTPNNSISRASGGYEVALTVAATRDAGEWTVTASGNDNLAGGKVYLVVIVGADTEQDDVTYT